MKYFHHSLLALIGLNTSNSMVHAQNGDFSHPIPYDDIEPIKTPICPRSGFFDRSTGTKPSPGWICDETLDFKQEGEFIHFAIISVKGGNYLLKRDRKELNVKINEKITESNRELAAMEMCRKEYLKNGKGSNILKGAIGQPREKLEEALSSVYNLGRFISDVCTEVQFRVEPKDEYWELIKGFPEGYVSPIRFYRFEMNRTEYQRSKAEYFECIDTVLKGISITGVRAPTLSERKEWGIDGERLPSQVTGFIHERYPDSRPKSRALRYYAEALMMGLVVAKSNIFESIQISKKELNGEQCMVKIFGSWDAVKKETGLIKNLIITDKKRKHAYSKSLSNFGGHFGSLESHEMEDCTLDDM